MKILFIACTYIIELVIAAPSPALQRADTLYQLREFPENARTALELYRAECTSTPSVDALWRFSMASHFVGMRYEKDPEKQAVLFKEGKEFGEKAIEREPQCAPCHFWTAINMALYGQLVGKMKMLFSLRAIEEHLDQVIEKDASYAMGGAYRIKGLIEKNLPGILGGSNEKARQYFEKAIQVAPTAILNYLVLTQFLNEEGNQPLKAVQVANEGLSLENSDAILESKESREELKEFVKKAVTDLKTQVAAR